MASPSTSINKNQMEKRPETILVVEDNSSVRSFIRRALELNGYTIIDTGDVDEAVDICKQHNGGIHLLLTDMVLPKMNGRELAEKILSFRPGLKVAYMSGYANGAISQCGNIQSDSIFIEKPITLSRLQKKIREILS